MDATGKSLLAVRLKRPRARWKQPSAARSVHLRALADRRNNAMDITLRQLQVEVTAA
ncbi:MAG: hypothetical protein R3A52_02570 [Polyangiales bacterium]